MPATPIAATPVVPVPGATTALAAGIVAGPPIASLPLDERQAAGTGSAFA
jgi:membrane-bound lytic murein transglycosylase A